MEFIAAPLAVILGEAIILLVIRLTVDEQWNYWEALQWSYFGAVGGIVGVGAWLTGSQRFVASDSYYWFALIHYIAGVFVPFISRRIMSFINRAPGQLESDDKEHHP